MSSEARERMQAAYEEIMAPARAAEAAYEEAKAAGWAKYKEMVASAEAIFYRDGDASVARIRAAEKRLTAAQDDLRRVVHEERILRSWFD